jgi:CheY-like chemotaxis protein
MTKVAKPDVLLIEDSLEEAELTIYALRGTCTHVTVDTFARSEDAVSYLTRTGAYADRAAHTPQLIVLDLDMPGADARQALQRLKGDEELRGIPLIVLTAKRDSDVIKECYRLGANSVLCKASQLKDYFEQMQQLAKYWLQVNVAADSELDSDDDIAAPIRAASKSFNELRSN